MYEGTTDPDQRSPGSKFPRVQQSRNPRDISRELDTRRPAPGTGARGKMTTKGKGFMAKGPNTIDQNFAEKLFKYGRERVPEYSRLHPVVPQLYVQEWKTDMKNRKLIMQNAEIGGVPKYEHDENLFLDKREQMHYNVEDRTRVESKYPHMDRAKLLRPDFHHETSKYQSELMFRRDAELVQGK